MLIHGLKATQTTRLLSERCKLHESGELNALVTHIEFRELTKQIVAFNEYNECLDDSNQYASNTRPTAYVGTD